MFRQTSLLLALTAVVYAAHVKRAACPDGVNVATNPACCVFYSLRDDLQTNIFQNQCGEDVHESLRLAFHDAVGFSASGKLKGGGADGSMIIFDSIETAFHANQGIDDSVDTLSPLLSRHNVTAGDLIQFAAAVGITNCPGAPRLQFLSGRPNATIPADDGTVPEPTDSVSTILARIEDAGFLPTDLVSLLASHSIARADNVDPTIQQVPFDTTPFTFDSQFFLETLLTGTGFPGTSGNAGEVESPLPAEGEMRLESDFNIAHDSRTACQWQSFINDQTLMAASFAASMATLATIGQDVLALTDCTEAVPTNLIPLTKSTTYPAGTSQANIQQSCILPFPVLSTDPGATTHIPNCPNGESSC